MNLREHSEKGKHWHSTEYMHRMATKTAKKRFNKLYLPEYIYPHRLAWEWRPFWMDKWIFCVKNNKLRSLRQTEWKRREHLHPKRTHRMEQKRVPRQRQNVQPYFRLKWCTKFIKDPYEYQTNSTTKVLIPHNNIIQLIFCCLFYGDIRERFSHLFAAYHIEYCMCMCAIILLLLFLNIVHWMTMLLSRTIYCCFFL